MKDIISFNYRTKDNRHITREQAKQIVKEINDMLHRKDIKKIAQIEFKDKNSCNNYNINFNGIGQKSMETFTFYTEFKNTKAQELAEALIDKDGLFNKESRVVNLKGELKECRCLTNGYPYTKAVSEAMRIVQKISKNAFKIDIK